MSRLYPSVVIVAFVFATLCATNAYSQSKLKRTWLRTASLWSESADDRVSIFLEEISVGEKVDDAGLGAWSKGVDIQIGFGCPEMKKNRIKPNIEWNTHATAIYSQIKAGTTKRGAPSGFIPLFDTSQEALDAHLLVDCDDHRKKDDCDYPGGFQLMIVEVGEWQDSVIASESFYDVILPKLNARKRSNNRGMIYMTHHTLKGETGDACGTDCEVKAKLKISSPY